MKHHIGSVGFNHLTKEFCRLCGLRRGGRIKSGIPLKTRTNGICGEEGRHNDPGGTEVDGRKNEGGFLALYVDK